jgi:hypothetical protein
VIGRSLLLTFAFALASCSRAETAAPRPPIHVLTGLPLFWGEGGASDVLNGTTRKSRLITALEEDGAVSAIDKIDDHTLAQAKLLLMIQPPALIPEELVALDAWVRGGGAVVILADPQLDWESAHSPGDPRRAPVHSLLEPLYAHWGLTMIPDPPRAPSATVRIGDTTATMISAGTWQAKDSACAVESGARVADCRLEKGRALIVADADFVNPDHWNTSDQGNLQALRALISEATD